jgi:hypothetical protein
LGTRTNGRRRRRTPSTRNVRQSLGHGRGILCPYAHGHSGGTGNCADWCRHHAWDQKSKIRFNKATGSLLAGHGPLGPRALYTSLRNHSVFDLDQCADCDPVVGLWSRVFAAEDVVASSPTDLGHQTGGLFLSDDFLQPLANAPSPLPTALVHKPARAYACLQSDRRICWSDT